MFMFHYVMLLRGSIKSIRWNDGRQESGHLWEKNLSSLRVRFDYD